MKDYKDDHSFKFMLNHSVLVILTTILPTMFAFVTILFIILNILLYLNIGLPYSLYFNRKYIYIKQPGSNKWVRIDENLIIYDRKNKKVFLNTPSISEHYSFEGFAVYLHEISDKCHYEVVELEDNEYKKRIRAKKLNEVINLSLIHI